MNPALAEDIISILDSANDMTIATVREDGYPQATTVSYVNDGLTIYFGCAAASQKAGNIARNPKVALTVNLPYTHHRDDLACRHHVTLIDEKFRDTAGKLGVDIDFIGFEATIPVGNAGRQQRLMLLPPTTTTRYSLPHRSPAAKLEGQRAVSAAAAASTALAR